MRDKSVVRLSVTPSTTAMEETRFWRLARKAAHHLGDSELLVAASFILLPVVA
jgi:hypothetical protein